MSKKIYLCTNNFYTLFGTVSISTSRQPIATAQKLNIPPKTAERYLKQWCLSGQLNHTAHGKYAKP